MSDKNRVKALDNIENGYASQSERENVRIRRKHKGENLLLFPDDYIVIDTETTGLDPSCCDIIEIGAVKISSGVIVDEFQMLINPECEIDQFISELTGITNEMLCTAPTIEVVIPIFADFIKNSILVGHNVHFDINFLYDNFELLNLILDNDFIDTMRLSRRLFKDFENHKLQTVLTNFGISTQGAHRALADAIATNEAFQYMSNYVQQNMIDISTYGVTRDSGYNYKNQTKASDICPTVDIFDEEHLLFRKTCVFTGALEKVSRAEAMQLVVNIGGSCADAITNKTNFLILGNNDFCRTIKDGKSSKQKKAEQLILRGNDLQIISENVFYDLFLNER